MLGGTQFLMATNNTSIVSGFVVKPALAVRSERKLSSASRQYAQFNEWLEFLVFKMPENEDEFEFPESLSFLLFSSARYKVLFGGRGGGKCLALGTKVIMADGSLCAIENVRKGDAVMGPDSKPRNVLGVTRGRSELYKISQTSGIDYVVNNAHILSLKKSKSSYFDVGEKMPSGNYRRPNGGMVHIQR